MFLGNAVVAYKGPTRYKRGMESGNKGAAGLCYNGGCPVEGKIIEIGTPYIGIPYKIEHKITRDDDKGDPYQERKKWRATHYFHPDCFVQWALWRLEHRKDYEKKRGRKTIDITEEQKKRRRTLMEYIYRDKIRLLESILSDSEKRITLASNSLMKHYVELNQTYPYDMDWKQPQTLVENIGKLFGEDNVAILPEDFTPITLNDLVIEKYNKKDDIS